MDIFVISLPDDTERRKSIMMQAEKLGLEFKFFDAIDGRQGLPDEYKDMVDYQALAGFWRELTVTEIACALSHALLARHIATVTKQSAIILEDDAILWTDFADLVRSGALDQSGMELLLLYHHNTRVLRWPKRKLFRHYQIMKLFKSPWGAVAYYVSVKGAREIAERSLPIHGVSDWGFDILKIRSGCVVPRIVQHPPVSHVQTNMKERAAKSSAPPRRPRRKLSAKLADPEYWKYFSRKMRAHWIYRP